MNREIKFRAWSAENKKMYKHDEINSIHFHNGLVVTNKEEMLFPMTTVLMEYTGMTDRNGVNIYEGDIVKVFFGGDSEIREVSFFGEHGYPAFDFKNWEGETNGMSEMDTCEDCSMIVIGNIYENEELSHEYI